MSNLPYSSLKKIYGERKWDLLTKECPECGGKFVTRDPHKVYCSVQCRRHAIYKNKKR